MNLDIDLDVAREYGFPEAAILAVIRQELGVPDHKLVEHGWIKLSNDDLFDLLHGSVGRSTIRASVMTLVKNGLLIKGRPEGVSAHIMDRTLWFTLPKATKKRK